MLARSRLPARDAAPSPGNDRECEHSFRGKVLCLFLLDSQVKNSGRPKIHGSEARVLNWAL